MENKKVQVPVSLKKVRTMLGTNRPAMTAIRAGFLWPVRYNGKRAWLGHLAGTGYYVEYLSDKVSNQSN